MGIEICQTSLNCTLKWLQFILYKLYLEILRYSERIRMSHDLGWHILKLPDDFNIQSLWRTTALGNYARILGEVGHTL
jgi:hypothetical protein